MRRRVRGLLLALALLGPAGPGLGEEPPEAVEPPPGTPADVALWRRGQQVGEAVVAARTEAGRLQQRVRASRLLERLDAGAAAPAAPPALGAARDKLRAAWERDYEVAARPWPVDPTRVCWYQMLALDSALRAPGAGEAGPARAELAACVEKAELAAGVLRAANQALAGAADDAERALAPPAAAPAADRGG